MDGQLGVPIAGELHFRVVTVQAGDVFEIFLLIGSVHADEVMVVGELVHQNVVDESSVLV